MTTTHYVLDAGAGLTQVLSDGTNTYLYGNERLAQYQAGMRYFGADGLGSVRQIYDASAVVVGSSRYDPYGNSMSQRGVTSIFGYTGEQQDATGLTYLRARYYSAAQGRFITRDPWEGNYALPGTLDHWLYVRDNPVNFLDPSGLIDQGPAEVGAQVVLDRLMETYNVRIKKDWGVGTVYEYDYSVGEVVPKPCGWDKGAWELRELWWVLEAVEKTSNKMGGPEKFKSAMQHQVVNVVRKPALRFDSPRTWPWPVSAVAGDITLDAIEHSEDYAIYSTVHEFGHLWDTRKGRRLSRNMSFDLNTTSCTVDDNNVYCVFDVNSLEAPPGSRTNPYAGNSIQEDWAEAFANYVFPAYYSSDPAKVQLGPLRRRYVVDQINAIP